MVIKKRGQVWVETVTYTLIGFIMIGLVLSFVQPKIQEYRDKTTLEQSIGVMKDLDQTIREVGESAVGNKRKVDVLIREGSMEISPANNTIIMTIDNNKYTYSEPGTVVTEGNLKILTINKGQNKVITLALNYTNSYSLLADNSTNEKIITKASNAYSLFISNKGGDNRQIEINVS